MTLIIAFLVSHIGLIGGALVGVGGVVFGMFRHQQAKTVEAQAASTVAEKQSQDDQANAAASAATTQAVVNRSEADTAAQATTPTDIDAQLAAIGAQRKE